MNSSIYTVALYAGPTENEASAEAAERMAARLEQARYSVTRVAPAAEPYTASPPLKGTFASNAHWTMADAARAHICKMTQATIVLPGAEVYLGECLPELNKPSRANANARSYVFTPVILVNESGYFDTLANTLKADEEMGGPRCILVKSQADAVACLGDLARNHLMQGKPLAFKTGRVSALPNGVLRYNVFSG
jgi:hypothetical protein